ncbi:hypothetical protein PMAYCL1PPCAC_05000, partial [Pristionchus mayeri]
FLSRVKCNRTMLSTLKESQEIAYFCPIHVADGPIRRRGPRPPDVVPQANEKKMVTQSSRLTFSGTLNRVSQYFGMPSDEKALELFPDYYANHERSFVCNRFTNYYRISPDEPSEARQFFNSLR